MRSTALAALLALLTACSSGSKGSTTQLKLKGHLASGTPGAQTTPLRLAMAWYPAFGGMGPTSPAGAVVPQGEVTFEGNFPIQFSFEVEGPPPAKALVDLAAAGGTGLIGYGVLIAYKDGNGNRSFDPIPAGGASPIDTIVGLSMPDPSLPPPPHSYYVVYLAGSLAPSDYWAAFSLQQGYNLLQLNSNFGVERIPLDSDVTIAITSTAALDLYACPDIFLAGGYAQKACGIDPYRGSYQAQGAVFASETGTSLTMAVYDGRGNIADAAVTLDGEVVPYFAASEVYHWDSATTLTGAHTLSITVPGRATEALPFTIPDQFTVLAPLDGQTLTRGAPVPISWTAAAGTAYYDIYFLANDATEAWLFHDLPSATSVTTPAIAYSGPAHVSVLAIGTLGVGSQGSFLTPGSKAAVTVTFAP